MVAKIAGQYRFALHNHSFQTILAT